MCAWEYADRWAVDAVDAVTGQMKVTTETQGDPFTGDRSRQNSKVLGDGSNVHGLWGVVGWCGQRAVKDQTQRRRGEVSMASYLEARLAAWRPLWMWWDNLAMLVADQPSVWAHGAPVEVEDRRLNLSGSRSTDDASTRTAAC